jgi:hypothetical protein
MEGAGPAESGSERMTVLRLLEQGKITAAEASELLLALGRGGPGGGGPPRPPRPGFPVADPEAAARRVAERLERLAGRGRRHAEHWARHADEIAARAAEQAARAAEQVGENVSRVLANLPDYLDRAARAGWGAWGPGYRFEHAAEGELEGGEDGPAGLDLEGWNGQVALRAVPGARVRLLLRETVHAASEEEARQVADRVAASVSGRQVSVQRREEGDSWPGALSLEADLPAAAVWSGVVRTGNGRLGLAGLTVRGLRLESSNGRITLEGGAAEDVTALTSNARIEVAGLRGRADLRTSNAPIIVAWAGAEGEGEVQAVTSNGSIEVAVPPGTAVDVDASTTNGRIDPAGLGGEAPAGRGSGRADLRWRSPGWDGAASRVRLMLRTSNGSIRFI